MIQTLSVFSLIRKDSRQTIQENLLRSRKSGEVRIKVGRNDEFFASLIGEHNPSRGLDRAI